MTTELGEKRQVEVPWRRKPTLGDISRHVNKLYALKGREGVLPTEIVVIPDTQIMYNKSDSANVFDLYEVDSLRVGEATVEPVLTHTCRWTQKHMGYYRLWVFKDSSKKSLKLQISP